MKRDYNAEYRAEARQAMEIAVQHQTSEGYSLYLCFTKYGRKIFQQNNKKKYEDAQLDYELGILSEEDYKLEIIAYEILENAIADAIIYW